VRQRSLHACFALCANARFTLDAQRFIPTLDASRLTFESKFDTHASYQSLTVVVFMLETNAIHASRVARFTFDANA
jgi:hypothetical protein